MIPCGLPAPVPICMHEVGPIFYSFHFFLEERWHRAKCVPTFRRLELVGQYEGSGALVREERVAARNEM